MICERLPEPHLRSGPLQGVAIDALDAMPVMERGTDSLGNFVQKVTRSKLLLLVSAWAMCVALTRQAADGGLVGPFIENREAALREADGSAAHCSGCDALGAGKTLGGIAPSLYSPLALPVRGQFPGAGNS